MQQSARLDASLLTVQLNAQAPSLPPLSELKFGTHFTPHMLEADWTAQAGWGEPRILPFANLSLHPASSALHYGLEVFEGLKAFRCHSQVALFRPELNVRRLLRSCERMCLPTFDEDELLSLIRKLVEIESPFVPDAQGYSLYVRPLVISTQPTLGVAAPAHAKLLVMCSPVGPYFAQGFKAIQLLADSRFVRAWPGSTGEVKCGGNYGGTIMSQAEAVKHGCSQILWLFPDNNNDFFITECGAMNVFVYWRNHEGKDELATFPLEQNLVLPGVTRDSILRLASDIDGLLVSEKRLRVHADLMKGLEEGRIYEVFGCGTACAVAPIGGISFEGKQHAIPLGKQDAGREEGIGPLSQLLRQKLWDIQYGKIPNHPWLVKVSGSYASDN